MAKPAPTTAGGKPVKKVKKNITTGVVHVNATFNNTHVTITDDQGNNKFDPAEIEAHRGDVIRFTLKTGVHNMHFLPDSNSVKDGLPPASQLLQLPGQTVDLKVTMADGKYYLQCDPHAALGMKAKLEVEAKQS